MKEFDTDYSDDAHVMRYLMHHIKGLSPVAGSELDVYEEGTE